jgi:DMSO/TMAO reductase YedYZ heme-binding membrane subunit
LSESSTSTILPSAMKWKLPHWLQLTSTNLVCTRLPQRWTILQNIHYSFLNLHR